MITATALDLIKLSLKMAGVLAIGQTPQAEDTNDVFTLLNSMLATWNINRWLIYHCVDVAHQATGQISYTVGPFPDDFQVFRPDRLQAAYVRLNQATQGGSGPTDFPLQIIETHEEYAAIRIKRLQSFPSLAFYDATYPQGTLYVWPIPNENYEIHIILREHLLAIDNMTDPIMFPPEYYEALLYNLVGRICLLYQLPMNPGVVALASAALNAIRVANHRVANMSMPAGLMRQGGWATHGAGGVFEGTFTLDDDVLGPV